MHTSRLTGVRRVPRDCHNAQGQYGVRCGARPLRAARVLVNRARGRQRATELGNHRERANERREREVVARERA